MHKPQIKYICINKMNERDHTMITSVDYTQMMYD